MTPFYISHSITYLCKKSFKEFKYIFKNSTDIDLVDSSKVLLHFMFSFKFLRHILLLNFIIFSGNIYVSDGIFIMDRYFLTTFTIIYHSQ